MACGIAVLATPIGAIPDVIINGKTGFIMENNSLEYIVEHGGQFVEDFTFERTVAQWKEGLEQI